MILNILMDSNKPKKKVKYILKEEAQKIKKNEDRQVRKPKYVDKQDQNLSTNKSQKSFVSYQSHYPEKKEQNVQNHAKREEKYEKKKHQKPKYTDSTKVEKNQNPGRSIPNFQPNMPNTLDKKANLLPTHQLISGNDSRFLKKLFIQKNNDVQRLLIQYEKDYPMIWIVCMINGKQQMFDYKRIVKVLDSSVREKRERVHSMIRQIYDSLYRKVDPLYYGIGIFGVHLANSNRWRFRDKNFVDQRNKQKLLKDYMFYFAIDNEKVNFVVLDGFINPAYFSSKNVEELKKTYPAEYKLYEQFAKKFVEKSEVEQETKEFFGQEEVDSDQEERAKRVANQKKVPLSNVKARLIDILEKDLTEFQEKIEQNNEIVMKSQEKGSQMNEQLLKLADQVMEDQSSLDNFIETRDKIKEKIQHKFADQEHQKKKLKMFLKQMIIAEKQLESSLPILSRKREILEKLDKYNLLILEGETGSGKSTQLPQILCEKYNIFQNEDALPVLITQPRKLATRTLAERVASEMEEEVHNFVDYQTTLMNETNKNAKIIFKMDRLVLDELKVDPILSKYCCLVIDEAHQRTISIDVILGLIKNLLSKRKDFKVIITSASMDTGLFKQYYNTDLLKVSGRMFPVTEYFQPMAHKKDMSDKIEAVFMEKVMDGKGNNMKKQYRGHVLVFCSGVDQITDLVNRFTKKLNPTIFKVLPLHGKMTPEEQRQVFTSSNHFKVIFASRIAETSITIDGVKVVIDPGEDREMVFDQKSKITSMQLKKISKSSAKQRAGRAGRTNTGFCFRLYSKRDYEMLSSSKVPEIKNMALDTVVLRLKSLNIQDVLGFPYIEKPKQEGLKASLNLMKMLGCLNQDNEKITPIGEFLVKLPIQPFLARSIMEAMLMDQLIEKKKQAFVSKLKLSQKEQIELSRSDLSQQIIRIICMVTQASNIFFVKELDRQKADKLKFQKFSNEEGDFFYLKEIYSEFIRLFERRKSEERQWVKNHFLNIKTLHQVRELEREISMIKKRFGLDFDYLRRELRGVQIKMLGCKSYKDILLSCLITSFAANLCLYSENERIGYTLISLQKPIQIYGTSTLSLQGIHPKWILSYDFFENDKGITYCKVAHAVDYNFMIENVNPYITKQFQLQKAKLMNPFYDIVRKDLSSLAFMDVMADFRQRYYNNKEDILSKFSLNYYEDLNQIQFLFKKKDFTLSIRSFGSMIRQQFQASLVKLNFLKTKNYEEIEDPEILIETYIRDIQKKYQRPLRYHYVGSVYLSIDNGFELKAVDLASNMHVFKINAQGEIADWIQNYCSGFGVIEKLPYQLIAKITDEEDLTNFIRTLEYLKESYKINGVVLKWTQQLEDTRRKVPQAKLFARFWAGEPDKNMLLLTFDSSKNQKNNEQMMEVLNNGLLEIRQKRPTHPILKMISKFGLTKSKKGVNCFPTRTTGEIDEYELHQLLFKAHADNLFGFHFQMPTRIKKFREPDIDLASKTESDWEEQIRKLLRKNKLEDDKYTVRAWGYHHYNKNDKEYHKLGAIEKQLKVQWFAQIKSYDLNKLGEFKDRNSGKEKLLGAEKAHFRFQFEQVAVVTTKKVFDSLYDEYQYILQQIKPEFPSVTFTHFENTFRNLTKVFIKLRGPHRDQLLQPSYKLLNLFTPKLIKFDESNFRFLDKFTEGGNILEDLEQEYNLKIYFAFDRKLQTIKLYCQDRLQKQITQKLREKIKAFKFFTEKISYRGKNLNKVKEVLDIKKEEISNANDRKRLLNYEIIFKFRQVRITSDFTTFEQVKNSIMKLINKEKGECDICSDLIQRPFRLHNCRHSFCTVCLSSYIRECITSQNKELLECPQICGKMINIYDSQKILTDTEFNKLCDIQIAKHIEKRPEYHSCLSPNCENIFFTEESKRSLSFECDLCGKWYCYKCKESHKGYSCQDWKMKLDDGTLLKLGIKKCPSCGTGIQRNQGCNHMTCISCKAHICWVCLKTFKTATECYNHLAKQCGGIFPANPNQ